MRKTPTEAFSTRAPPALARAIISEISTRGAGTHHTAYDNSRAVNAERGEGENSLMEQEHIPGQERRIAEVLSLRTFHNAASFMSIMRQSNWRSLWPLQQHKREAFRWSSSGDLLPHIKTLGETPKIRLPGPPRGDRARWS